MNTIYTCGIKINPMTVEEILSQVNQWVKEGRKNIQITGVNARQIAFLDKDKQFASYINSSDIVNIDGTLVYLYLKLKGYKVKQKTLCADILYRFLEEANKMVDSIYLLGASPEVVEKVATNLKQQYPNISIVGIQDGYFKDEKAVVEDIKAKNPKYLFLGMPSPMKERFVTKYRNELNATINFGVGGMFDIIAGKASRAPGWVQSHGLEWFYRITQNPIGHTKRVFWVLFPCLKIFSKDIFKHKKQIIS